MGSSCKVRLEPTSLHNGSALLSMEAAGVSRIGELGAVGSRTRVEGGGKSDNRSSSTADVRLLYYSFYNRSHVRTRCVAEQVSGVKVMCVLITDLCDRRGSTASTTRGALGGAPLIGSDVLHSPAPL